MNALSRALRVFASSATSTERLLVQPTTFILQSYATAATRKKSKPLDKSSSPSNVEDSPVSERSRPAEIPYQPKVANFVNLIGHVLMPVQFQTSPDGKTWATTVITREHAPDNSHLWIPIIFEGDMAHVAACHLKVDDCIHIAGELSPASSNLKTTQSQSNLQILVQSLNFVQGYPLLKKVNAVSKQEGISNSSASEKLGTDPSRKDFYSEQSENDELKGSITSARKNSGSLLSTWKDLLDDPKQWWDFRDSKQNGSVSPRFPDFKRKDWSLALWLDSAPTWVLSELEGLEFDVLTLESAQKKGEKEEKGDASWKDLLENPDKWWDNRLDKWNIKYPDFKHKETGEGLWLDSSPRWVLPKLPPLKPKQEETNSTQTPLSSEYKEQN